MGLLCSSVCHWRCDTALRRYHFYVVFGYMLGTIHGCLHELVLID